jgi:hypothetical protein
MTLQELEAKLQTAGVAPIYVDNDVPEATSSRLLVTGGLDKYLVAVRAFRLTAVIVYSVILDETWFRYARDEADEDESMDMDLCDKCPQLEAFKGHIGERGIIYLSAQMRSQHLDLALEEIWWLELQEARERAIEKLENEAAVLIAATNAEDEAAAASIIELLHGLAEDPKFAKMPTQKAMMQYALRKFPELKDFDPADLKAEIQIVKAKIDAGFAP